MQNRKIMISLSESKCGGPYFSHLRIMQSFLSNEFEFIPWNTPQIRKMLSLKYIKTLREYVCREDPDIVHITGLQLSGFIEVILCRIIAPHSKLVIAIRGSSLEALRINRLSRIIVRYLEKWTIKHCDKAYGVSDYVSSWSIVKKYPDRYFGTIYNIPDKFTDTLEDRNAERVKLGVNEQEILVVSTGRITEDKGYDILLNIITSKEVNENVKFLIIGDGEYLPIMRKYVKANNIKSVITVGHVQNVSYYLSMSDIFILCTKHETLSNSIIEAGQHKLPVVASNVGGIPEIIGNGRGELFPVGDIKEAIKRINYLSENEAYRKELGQCLYEHIQAVFSEEKNMMELKALYNSL